MGQKVTKDQYGSNQNHFEDSASRKRKEKDFETNITSKSESKSISINTEKSESTTSFEKFQTEDIKGGSLWKDIRQIYKFKEVLGGGHFGTVRTAYLRSGPEPKKLVAIKSISKRKLSPSDLADLMKEVEILSSLDHPNIVKFIETYHDQHYFHIIMELCQGKEVFDKIIEEGHITEARVANIIYQVLSAIAYCHSKGITHRDIKPENILLVSNEKDSDVKLIDFGLSRKYSKTEKMHTILGTPYYVAPEVLKGEYDEKCDVWSIGAITYMMLSGDPPFIGNSNSEIFNKIVNSELVFPKSKWKQISLEAIDFIRRCMVRNPEDRFPSYKAIEHKWFTKVSKEMHSETKLSAEILQSLKSYSSPEKFKKMVLKHLVNSVSEKDLKNLKQAFQAMDYSHTGHIDINQLSKAFNSTGISLPQEEIKRIIETADQHNKGKLDYSDFLVATLDKNRYVTKERLIEAFKYFDIDDSGTIDSLDIKNAFLRSGKEVLNHNEVNKIMKEIIKEEGNDRITLAEFLKLFGYECDEFKSSTSLIDINGNNKEEELGEKEENNC